MQSFEAARTELEEANPKIPQKTLFLFFSPPTLEITEVILKKGFTPVFNSFVELYQDPINSINSHSSKEIIICRVAIGTPGIHHTLSPPGKYTIKNTKNIIATYLVKLKEK